MCSRKTKRSLSSRRDASNSLLARGKWAMCIYRRKLKPILQKRAARSYCSLPPRRSVCSTNHMQRRLGFFTSPVEINTFGQNFWSGSQKHRVLACGQLGLLHQMAKPTQPGWLGEILLDKKQNRPAGEDCHATLCRVVVDHGADGCR